MTYKILIITTKRAGDHAGGVAIANTIVNFDTVEEADLAMEQITKADAAITAFAISAVAMY